MLLKGPMVASCQKKHNIICFLRELSPLALLGAVQGRHSVGTYQKEALGAGCVGMLFTPRTLINAPLRAEQEDKVCAHTRNRPLAPGAYA